VIRIFLFLSVFLPVSAHAQVTIAVVDFQKASQAVQEGAQIQAELNKMQQLAASQIKDMEKQIMGLRAEYDKQAMILSDDTKMEKQREIMAAQQEYQQAVAMAQQNMAQTYEQKAGALFQKMRKVCEVIGAEKGYSLILEISQGGVVYAGDSEDITTELIKRYDAGG